MLTLNIIKSRLCPICDSKDAREEYHYFSNCENYKLKNLQDNFLREILEINSCFSSLSKNEILLYGHEGQARCVYDCSVCNKTSFCYSLLCYLCTYVMYCKSYVPILVYWNKNYY